jgi:prepilin-type N-terminal cleavage/methylation domain-containing protein
MFSMLRKRNAFTLIELLVAIAIVGILSGFIFVSMNSAINASKDAKREADVAAIAKAIMAYSSSSGTYPVDTSCDIVATGGCSTLPTNLQNYLTTLPRDPNGVAYYRYASPDSGVTCTVTATLSDGSTYTYTCGSGFAKTSFQYAAWAGYKQITLSPVTPVANYQVRVNVASSNCTAASCNADFSDLRFTDTINGNALSYWVESGGSGSAIVWVKVPNSGTSSFYMYYGNSGVSAPSAVDKQAMGVSVFDFFDDFLGSSLDANKWTVDYGTPIVAGGYVENTGSTNERETSKLTFGTNYCFRSYSYLSGGSNYAAGLTFNEHNGILIAGISPYNLELLTYREDWGASTGVEVGTAYNSAFHVFEIIRNGSISVIMKVDDVQKAENTTNFSIVAGGARQGIGNLTGAVQRTDWALVRKYQSPEPVSTIN